mmetsp:Transcript_28114/g.89373  ORF Transcript_28114/g.89373 Transcript_28114/m.89373 type:complete len:210 (+) Transcript_28114:361-990(+)
MEVINLLCGKVGVAYQGVAEDGGGLVVHHRRVARGAPRAALQRLGGFALGQLRPVLLRLLLLRVALGDAQGPGQQRAGGARLHLGRGLRVELRAPLVEGPSRHAELLEGVVGQREEPEHRHGEVADVRGEVRVVLHGLGAHEQLAHGADPVELVRVVPGDDPVLAAVDDESGALHVQHGLVVLEPLVHQHGEGAHAVPEEAPDAQEGRD